MNNFLVEILIQEMPYRFIPSAINKLREAFEGLFCENNLKYEKIDVFATPRRLAVIIEGMSDKQDDITKEIKGPILNIALDENKNFTAAAIGFAKKNGVETAALFEKDGYIYAKIEQRGKSTKEILSENVEKIILGLEGAHFMRWKDNDIKFTRPIENVLAIFNEDILPLKIIDKNSTNFTYGLRFTDKIEIKNAKDYVNIMRKNNVIVNQEERRAKIVELADNTADKINATVHYDDDLLDEVTYLTEAPKPILCDFDEKYLQIPNIVNVTVMAVHQRYFPLYDKCGKLLNRFITMANFVSDDEVAIKNIQNGNKRVVAARLEDGVFFYQEDTKTPLIEKVEKLRGMTFQRGLGTLYDKTQRIIKLSDGDENIKRCALLCKADLATKLVFEFTELQGYIGEDYALKSGEAKAVATGIKEHYFPLNADCEIASSIEGKIVGIADKIDTICATFLSTQENKKKRPTGSNDPLGVRRAVIGTLRTVIDGKMQIDLSDLIARALDLLSGEFKIPIKAETKGEIEEFFINRLIKMYEGKYPQNVMQACANSSCCALCNLDKYFKNIECTMKLDEKIIENAKRVTKILPICADILPLDEKIFIENEEKNLYEAIKITQNVEQFAKLADAISQFFDKVLVMDKDEKIKNNRIALLNLANDKFKMLCDFSRL